MICGGRGGGKDEGNSAEYQKKKKNHITLEERFQEFKKKADE